MNEMDEREADHDTGPSSDSDAVAETKVFPLIERRYDPYGFITIGDALDSLSRASSSKP